MSGVNRQVLLSCLQLDLLSYPLSDKKSPFEGWKAVAATQLRESVFKKFEDPNPRADAKAIAKFLESNKLSGTWEIVSSLPSWDDELIGVFKRYVDDFLHPSGDLLVSDFNAIWENGELGPGASLLGGGGDFYTKMFSSSLSTTSLALYSSYRQSLASHPIWYRAEHNRLNTKGGPKVVEGNRLTCVPKNVDISRTIATEPTLNMWYQLGVGNILRSRLSRYFGIDLASVADVNRELARRGSVDDSRSTFVTIDLESASDSISLKMVRKMFPKWFTDLLIDLRSPLTVLPDGQRVQLEMVSTMGNGYTFPLQTFIFSCVVSAVYEELGIPRTRVDAVNPNWSVFGDDIIVRREAYNRVVHLLTLLGFRVNQSKSFYEGPFRESCGCDFFKGHNVRGVYLKRLETAQDTYVAFNKFVRWVSVTGIDLPETLRYLLKKCRFNPVPYWESDDAGVKVPLWMASIGYDRNGTLAYKAVVQRKSKIRLTEESVVAPQGQRKREYNPDGLIIAISRGEFGDGEMTPRQRSCRTVNVRRRALSWETPPISDLRGFLAVEWHAFSAASTARWPHFGEAVGPIAGPVDGKRWESAFWGLF